MHNTIISFNEERAKKTLFWSILFWVLFIPIHLSFSQNTTCSNLNFEQGNFNGWQAEMGNCCPLETYPSPITPGVHTIMTGNGTDVNTCGALTVVAPGSTFSARLGNDDTGGKGEKLRYVMTITESNVLFIYKYAIVMQEPGHLPEEQPRFTVSVIDSNGDVIDNNCGVYMVVADINIPGFQSCLDDILFKDWTTVGLNLSNYIGQEITVEFATGDCSLGGHFGYAYIDAYCSNLDIATAYCVDSTTTQLTAPIGFEYLWSTGETTQSIFVQNAQNGDAFSCLLTSVTGCQVTISTVINFQYPEADFTLSNTCYTNAVFNNTSYNSALNFDTFLWDFGDGTTSTLLNPTHSYAVPGTYIVSFTITNSLGCVNSITKPITVYEIPMALISYSSDLFCTDYVEAQPVLLNGVGLYEGGIFSAPAGLNIDSLTGDIFPSLSQPGFYTITYSNPNTFGCSMTPATTTIRIIEAATVAISYSSPVFCVSQPIQPVQITGSGPYQNGLFTAIPGGLSISANGTIDPSQSNIGSYTVFYSLVFTNGCDIVQALTTVEIRSAPQVDIVDGRICLNESGAVVRPYELNTELNNSNYAYQWFLNTNSISNATSAFYSANETGNYTVVVTDTQTGCFDSDTAVVTTVSLDVELMVALENEFSDTTVIVQLIDGGVGPFFYQLDNGTFQESNQFFNVAPGSHTVTVVDQDNCIAKSKDFIVLGYPKYFTPNGDGFNDVWSINTSDLYSYKLFIYDRYGKLLYTIDEKNRSWDGNHQERQLPADDYWFVIEYQLNSANDELKSFRSHFTLKR